MNTKDVIARLRRRQEIAARRGDQRHRHLNQELDTVAARLAQIETNTGRITDLERQIVALAAKVDAHHADIKQHTGKS